MLATSAEKPLNAVQEPMKTSRGGLLDENLIDELRSIIDSWKVPDVTLRHKPYLKAKFERTTFYMTQLRYLLEAPQAEKLLSLSDTVTGVHPLVALGFFQTSRPQLSLGRSLSLIAITESIFLSYFDLLLRHPQADHVLYLRRILKFCGRTWRNTGEGTRLLETIKNIISELEQP